MTRRDCLLELKHGALIVLTLIIAATAGMCRFIKKLSPKCDEKKPKMNGRV